MEDSVSFKYQKEGTTKDLIELLIKDYNLSIKDAFETLYNSQTYEKLSNSATGLFFQSPLYVYSFLKKELETGKMQ